MGRRCNVRVTSWLHASWLCGLVQPLPVSYQAEGRPSADRLTEGFQKPGYGFGRPWQDGDGTAAPGSFHAEQGTVSSLGASGVEDRGGRGLVARVPVSGIFFLSPASSLGSTLSRVPGGLPPFYILPVSCPEGVMGPWCSGSSPLLQQLRQLVGPVVMYPPEDPCPREPVCQGRPRRPSTYGTCFSF